MVSKKRVLELNKDGDCSDPANLDMIITKSKYAVDPINISERFVKELARAHDALTDYGKEHYEPNEVIQELEPEEWCEGDIPVLAIVENYGEPGEDYIVIYNYEGVMRMTGIMADSHCHTYVYKINQN